ncbi:UDP-N-acetylmuramoyl-L-alanyl-D-glutamate--2,6-diaminopimelate ligase [Leucobacter chromiireducens subsp. solipictus]|uniref:UDP-N-acetylmuramyl-tripeptide synthetase n=1 Tax=Leucobacter chromiireducens subsp. solipictus TaxID=398235 RepID=A0ABS1SB04_9MICO|nr:UDP-N-acetylmuramoyl-L-alanyl-D-glutamate--2,6-diaminopimelate ligase [Leucobacter chromiireducens]MBL3677723.1 UDP-N-acetylmuramoyl-L-alanyl-D-glutamate--2,6-diaminopimelate ligase [Leucobacter chromiireducens subsp. solipictus]
MSIRPQTPTPTPLRELVTQFGLEARGLSEDAAVTGVSLDSRDVRPGDLYIGMPGAKRHGADFAAQAAASGASAMLTDAAGAELATAAGVELPVLVSARHPRELLGDVAAAVYGTADFDAKLFGVTGTNGKTSVVYILAELIRAAGLTPGLSSTAERRVGEEVIPANLTSPEASELHGLLARMREREVEGVAIEVSAQAVVRHRLDGVHFDVVAFNNFSQDHLDEFGDLESYFAAKLALFTPERASRGVVVVDSPYGQRIAKESQIPVTRLATEYGQSADWHLAITRQSLDGVSFVLQGPEGAHFRGSVPVFGGFMAENAALALIMLHEAGIPLAQVAAGLERGRIPVYIPGRLEEMTEPGSAGPRFFVDYGHTPGAFAAMLDALGEVAPGKIIFMFGADGDRDTTKREEMGRIAAAGSDTLIICDYHPRSEPPEAIRAQLLTGARAANHAEVIEEGDPRRAVRLAISLAAPGDVILYAGPGHEDHQEVAGQFIPYSARDEVRGALREAGLLS